MNTTKKIVVIEDEEDILEVISFNLSREGFQVIGADTGEKGLECLRTHHPDLALLDLMLPGIDGMEVCRRVRKDPQLSSIPVVMLTAKGEESDIVAGLELGADDYITKPFSPKILIARIRAILRRNREPVDDDSAINIHGMVIQPHRQEVLVGDDKVEMTSSEFKILHFLARRPGWVFTRYQIVSAVHGDQHTITDRAIDVMIVSMRKKLGEVADCIQTVRGVGYRFKE